MITEDKTRGLYRKYEVKKLTNPTKQVSCVVLEWDDPIARVGIRAWAEELKRQGFAHLYVDLDRQLKYHEDREQEQEA